MKNEHGNTITLWYSSPSPAKQVMPRGLQVIILTLIACSICRVFAVYAALSYLHYLIWYPRT